MSKGAGAVGDQALGITNRAQTQSNTAADALLPTYQRMALNPQGLTQQQKSNMLTATGQGIGGSTAGVVGQGGLLAARTRNAGAADSAIAEAARQGDRQFSDAALNVENQDALLQRQQQTQGLEGLAGLYGGANQTALNALGQYTGARGVGNQMTNSLIGAAGQIGGAYFGRPA